MKEIKVYITDRDNAIFTCPECGFSTDKDMTSYKDIRKAVRIKCTCRCGNIYFAVLERRRYFRNDVDLPGVCISGRENTMRPILIKDLSRTGIKMEIEDRNGLNIGDKLLVEFHLNDKKQTFIRKVVIIRSLSGPYAGAEFFLIEPGSQTDQAIRLFMFSIKGV